MAYSTELNERISKATARWKNTASKKMFGGICYLLNGNMFCGIQKEALIVRLGINAADKALQQPHVKPFDPTGKPMKGWVLVEKLACQSDDDLNRWLQQARQFAKTLPAK
jgi:TfoX/Sxy family transcriptional regulator of competence genes